MKTVLLKISIVFIVVLCVFFVGCKKKENNQLETKLHDSTKWFTEEKLTKKGLSGLSAPTGLSDQMSTSDSWFNNGYSFSQVCPTEDFFFENAEKYFEYFKEHYSGLFGTTTIEKTSMSSNENWYIIKQSDSIEDYYDDNPSKLYKFYYVTDNTLEDGYFKTGTVYTFEIRYEFDTNRNAYCFKLFVESADGSHNGTYTYHYKTR